MKTDIKSIRPFGDTSILIEWENEIDTSILNDIVHFSNILKNKVFKNESIVYVPAYNSLTLIFAEPITDFAYYLKKLELSYKNTIYQTSISKKQIWKLPVCYDTSFGTDLEDYAKGIDLSVSTIIELHTQNLYTVYAIGFLPGFMYLGGLDEQLIYPRKSVPDLRITPGSVGIAGKQTGIYPQASPGGWNIIGNCPIPLFDATKNHPCFFSVGDQLKFYPISVKDHQRIKTDYLNGDFPLTQIKFNA